MGGLDVGVVWIGDEMMSGRRVAYDNGSDIAQGVDRLHYVYRIFHLLQVFIGFIWSLLNRLFYDAPLMRPEKPRLYISEMSLRI